MRLDKLRMMVLKSTQGLLYMTDATEDHVITMATLNIDKPINLGVIAAHGKHSPRPHLQSFTCQAAFPISCLSTGKYRTKTGVCNNIKNNVLWGSQSSQLLRFVPSAYADHKQVPRGGYKSAGPHCDTGNKYYGAEVCDTCVADNDALLPNPRFISTRMYRESPNLEDKYMTHMFIIFGQFLDHDLDLSPEIEVEGGCCKGHQLGYDGQVRDLCFDVHRPCDAPQYPIVKRTTPGADTPEPSGTNPDCMSLGRSSSFCNNTAGMREQFNGVTSFIDASMVYGSTQNTMSSLRRFIGGLKKTSKENLNHHEANDRQAAMAGDERVRENVLLACIHALFVREHNRLAKQFYEGLHIGTPKEKDEEAFQKTRRLVGAQMQNIVYGQYLTVLLGSRSVIEKQLFFDLSQKYEPDTNPGIKNAFSTAAYRFGHSGVQSKFQMRTPYSNVIEEFNLREHFFNLDLYYRENGRGAEKLLNGMLHQPARSIDHFVSQDVTQFLFGNVNGIGQDLLARNIQRGRDHGLAPYNEYREFCGLPRACSWDKPPIEIEFPLWTRLQEIYDRPSDIDLFVGGLMETPYNGGVVGRTFNCIIAQQFRDVKFGDRQRKHKRQTKTF